MNRAPILSVSLLALAAGIVSSASALAQTPAKGAETDSSADIIVTAQRREERLRDVPISITALGQDELVKSGVTSILDIERITPGLKLPMFGGFLQPSIRGISSAGAGMGDQSNVALYVDGVYQPSMSGQLIDLPDVEQVQVLKGPQGTLYGQNAAGGAIIITSIMPQFDFGGRFSASYGNHDNAILRGYVTGPIGNSEQVAFALAGSYQKRDGFRHDLVRGGRDPGLESTFVRGRVLVEPSDALSFTLAGYYTKRTDHGIYAGQPVGPGTPLGYALAGMADVPFPIPQNPRQFALSVVPRQQTKTHGFSLKADLDAGIGMISTTSAYGNVKVSNVADADYTAVNLGEVNPLNIGNEHFIQEINFASERFGRFSFSAGAFFMALKEEYQPNTYNGHFMAIGDPITVGPPLPPPLFSSVQYAFNRKRSYAGYIEGSYDVTDRINLSVGGRYAYEQQRTADNYGSGSTVLIPDPRGTVSFERFTPRATLRYELDPSSNIYASYSQGFKSGYVNSGDPFPLPVEAPVQPEKVYAYEIGYKGRPLSGVSLNLAAFHYDYKDIQVYTYSPPTELYQNAAAARIRGIEVDISISVAPGLTISAGATYLDAEYKNFPAASVFVPNAFGFGYDRQSINASGISLPRAPELTGNLAISYEGHVGPGTLGAYVSASYSSDVKFDIGGLVLQPEYATVNTELSFAPDGVDGLRFVLWGKNLTDVDYLSSVLTSQFVLGGSYADPRTYGVRVEFEF